ncbi:hypothetical protein [Litchfieldia alkalitelluris]|uniref:hypothetical protein n=1 Tax=Litchfieldia alkalitelluris TaxID=304268 RepID=UPI000996625D|nr:hypothetical protein [Litchfieldia alkalitelluris]
MKSIQDALYNWLSIKIVADARPDDTAAVETYKMFDNILKDDHKVRDIVITKDDVMYYVSYIHEEVEKKTRFPIELIDVMFNQIADEPEKYKNYPEE